MLMPQRTLGFLEIVLEKCWFIVCAKIKVEIVRVVGKVQKGCES